MNFLLEFFNTTLDPKFFQIIAIGQALNLAHDISKFPQAAVLRDRALLYKKNFPDFTHKCEHVERDCVRYKQQMIEVKNNE